MGRAIEEELADVDHSIDVIDPPTLLIRPSRPGRVGPKRACCRPMAVKYFAGSAASIS
jgi:hypothetical protein